MIGILFEQRISKTIHKIMRKKNKVKPSNLNTWVCKYDFHTQIFFRFSDVANAKCMYLIGI